MKTVPATPEAISRAAVILKEGGLVVMPTETVYGVACDALNPVAVRRVFEAKGRPADNPLIVHVASIEQARSLCRRWPPEAHTLAERFWPGPLTLVLERAPHVPPEVVAALDTVAVRMPSHPVALALIEAAGTPLAAPSANPFMQLSPTRVEHLDPALVAKVDLVLDGKACEVGLESTVVDVTCAPPRILRPGGVSRGEIQAALGRPLGSVPPESVRRAPGMYRRHYAPRAKVFFVQRLERDAVGLTFSDPASPKQIKMPRQPKAYGAALYDALYHLDQLQPGQICVESPPELPEWEAVWDRLRKAAANGLE